MALSPMLGNLAALRGASGILPPGMGIGALGAAAGPMMSSSLSVAPAPAAGAAGAAGALSAPSASSLNVAPAAGATPAAAAPAASSYAPNPYTNSTGGANAGNPYTNSTGGANAGGSNTGGSTTGAPISPAAVGAAVTAAAPAAFGGSGSTGDQQSTNINPYGAQNTRTSDWLTGGGGSHAMQGIVNRDPFAARGMEGDLSAYGITVPNTGSLTGSDVGLSARPMTNDPNSARQAATGFGPIYQANPIAPASAPWPGMGYGTPTPGYLDQGGSNAIDVPVAAGTPLGGYESGVPFSGITHDRLEATLNPPVAAGTPTQGYEPPVQGPSFSGVTRDRLNATIAARPVAAGTPLGGYEPALPQVAAGTPTAGYDALTSGTGGANRGGSPAPYLDPTGVLQEVFSGPDVAPAAPSAPINPFAGLGDFFSPPSQQAVDQMAGGYGIAPPVGPGFLEAGGASHASLPSYGLPRPPQPRPSSDPSFGGNLPQARPELPYSDQGGPRVPQARPDVGINPFGFRMPSYGAPRLPNPRPPQGGDVDLYRNRGYY